MTAAPRPTVVLLGPYGAQTWAAVQDVLSGSADVLVVEPQDETSLGEMALRILEIAPRRFHLAGLCLGGYLAFEIHRLARDRIAGMALINTSAAPDSEGQAQMRRERIGKLEAKRAQATFPDAAYVGHATAWLLGPRALGSPRTVSAVHALLAQIPIARSLAQQQAMLERPDSRPDLAGVRVPTLVVGGRFDRVCPAACSLEIGRGIAGADVRILEGCGHLAPVEQPERLAALMTGWLCSRPHDHRAHQHEEQL